MAGDGEIMTADLTALLARRAAERAVTDRQADYARQMRGVVEATFDLIERTGNLNPSLREVLAETGLSTQAFYRCFRSKDELFLVLLDEGRQRLVAYLSRRMAAAPDSAGQVGAWVRGVLAQAADDHAASRTRPFTANEDRIAELFPAEHAASVDRLAALLVGPVTALLPAGAAVGAATQAVYDLTFGALRRHLASRTRPTAAEMDHLVAFALGGIAADPGDVAGSPSAVGRRAAG